MGTGIAAAPEVTITSPLNASVSNNPTPLFRGRVEEADGVVTLRMYKGPTAEGMVIQKMSTLILGRTWSLGPTEPLNDGTYTAQAMQTNHAFGISRSPAVTFTVDTAAPTVTLNSPPRAPPVASFTWFPPIPHTGEPVSLVSTSSDTASAITGIAWALTSNGPLQAGGAVLTTSFSTPGDHVVRLRVTNAYGLASVATETINVVDPRPSLMQPFPVVRIAGTGTALGVNLRLLKVQQLPTGARITVRCKGRGCPIRSVGRVAVSNTRGVAPAEFRVFERSLRFGVTLEIWISKPGEIGKYTRFSIRRGKLPARVDMCLDPAGVKPLVCPSS